jgi:hypothetical protein
VRHIKKAPLGPFLCAHPADRTCPVRKARSAADARLSARPAGVRILRPRRIRIHRVGERSVDRVHGSKGAQRRRRASFSAPRRGEDFASTQNPNPSCRGTLCRSKDGVQRVAGFEPATRKNLLPQIRK